MSLCHIKAVSSFICICWLSLWLISELLTTISGTPKELLYVWSWLTFNFSVSLVWRAKDQPSGVPLSAVSSKQHTSDAPTTKALVYFSRVVGCKSASHSSHRLHFIVKFLVLKDIFVTLITFLIVYVCVLQVFLIIHYQPMVNALADVILNGDLSVFTPQTDLHSTHKNTVTHTRKNTT